MGQREWNEWDPKRIRPSGHVDVKMRDGRELYNVSTYECYWSWGSGSPYDIVSYRPALQT